MSGFRNFGPKVSQLPQDPIPGGGQFSDDEHSYEQVVFQANKAITDWELNLAFGITGNSGQRLLIQRLFPSGFITSDFLSSSDLSNSYSFMAPDPPAATTANKFNMLGMDLIVNGWPIKFDFTDSATVGINLITMPAPPVGVNTTRTDLVILEVWRALISPSPDVTNKSPTGQILRNGNARAGDSFPPGNENLADDIIDPILLVETTRRVQIQYRYRVISGIDLNTYPDGLDSPALVANTVPYLGGSDVNGSATIFNYSKVASDSGLWIAGAGTPVSATTLGTVDGFIYSIPLCAVFRRNSAAFNKTTNLNGGGLMSSSVSGRPDGLYSDQVVTSDVLDLRKSTVSEWNEIFSKTVQQIFDNSLITHQEITSTGPSGTSVLAKSDIGLTGHMGKSDGIRRYFSDRSVTETIVAKVIVVGAISSINVDLSALELSWAGASVNIIPISPVGTNIVGVNAVRIVDFVANTDHDALSAVAPLVNGIAYSVNIGPAIDRATITFDAPISNVTVYVELAIEYPAGFGAPRNLVSGHQLWISSVGAPAWIDTSGWVATSDANRKSVPASGSWWIDSGHRELAVHLVSTSQTAVFNTSDTDTLFIWERLNGGTITITDGLNAPYTTTNYTFNTAYTKVQLTGGIPVPSGTAVTVAYHAFRALPPVAGAPFDSFQFFFQSRAIQSLPVPAGAQTLHLIPRLISRNLYSLANGSGSPDSGFPYTSPSAQVPVGSLPAANFPESHLDTPSPMTIVGFGISTGFLQLNTFVPYDPNSAQVTLYSAAPDVTIDGDGRNFWPKSDDGSTTVYQPATFGQSLAFKQRHKVAFPVLMELQSDFTSIGRKGTYVLVIFSNWLEYDNLNGISLSNILSSSCAAVYRVRGNLMNARRS